MRKILMLGGIHGVGKSFLCKRIKETCKCEIYSASQLMRDYYQNKVDDNKRVEDIKLNQNILLSAINTYVPRESRIILDGHFCLLNTNNNVLEIPFETFQSIGVNGIIVLTDNADIIINRLNARDGTQYSSDFVNNFQDKEINYAKLIAKKLNVELLVCKNPVYDNDILDFINKIMGE